MTVTRLDTNGNSAKFHVVSKHGEFDMAFSFTLRTKVWQIPDADAEQVAAQELAEAIVSRHDMSLPFQELYIFAEHNTLPTLDEAIRKIRKAGF